jgi:UDP-N-acetylmuramoylalanine--D-glutamate ligase
VFTADPHRNAVVPTTDGVTWVDDSKATNPHAAAASLAAYDRVVWIAGGLLKGAAVDDLVRDAAPHLAAVVLLGTDRQPIRDALLRHAPDVPVVEVERLDTEAMSEVVAAARRLARPGDTVLLAPAAASMDAFRDYKERGELFAALAAR